MIGVNQRDANKRSSWMVRMRKAHLAQPRQRQWGAASRPDVTETGSTPAKHVEETQS
jgi:hypothetical protein